MAHTTRRYAIAAVFSALGLSGCTDAPRTPSSSDFRASARRACVPGTCAQGNIDAYLGSIGVAGEFIASNPDNIRCMDDLNGAPVCAECITDDDCPRFFSCRYRAVCEPPDHSCATDADCPPHSSLNIPYFCDQAASFCVQCYDDSQCDGNTQCLNSGVCGAVLTRAAD